MVIKKNMNVVILGVLVLVVMGGFFYWQLGAQGTGTNLATSITADDSSIQINQSNLEATTTIRATTYGGNAPYTYRWYQQMGSYAAQASSQTGSSYAFSVYNLLGSFKVYVDVTDSQGHTVRSNTVTIQVTG